jgi:NitT/TauT family transport system substrate-binding protein
MKPLIVGVNPWPGYEPIFLAEKLELFKKYGVAVKIAQFSSLGDVRRAFDRGQVDVVASTVIELLVSRDQSSRDGVAIYVTDYSNGGDVLLANPRLPSVKSLKGKRVAAEAGTVDMYVLYMALKSVGLSFSDLNVVTSSLPESELAYVRGEVDAVQGYPPVSQRLEELGARRIFDTSSTPGRVVDVLFTSSATIDSRRLDLQLFLKAFAEAQGLAINNKNHERQIMADRQKVSLEDFNTGFDAMIHLTPDEQAKYLKSGGQLEEILGEVYQVLKETRQITRDIDLSNVTTDKLLTADKATMR